jgi:PAS domain S-box-containing protein
MGGASTRLVIVEPALKIVPKEPGSAEHRDTALLHWMQELAPHGIFTTDNELRIQTWNHWLVTHSGLAANAVVGKPLLEVFPELLTRKLADQFQRAIEGQVSVLSTALHGYLLPFAVTARDSGFQFMQQTARIGPLLLNRTVCGTITTIEDVTQREVQARLSRQYAEELETKVRERTRKLDETVAQLESFSYTVAHDLRAPIRTFKGYSEILIEDYAGEFPEKAREYVERMKRAAEGMDLLTRDLLQFSRISRQQITREPINLTAIIDEIISHTPGLQVASVLSVQKPLHAVIGNRTMIQQCLSNLLDNALKFMVPERAPRITVRSELQQDANAAETQSSAPLPFIPAVAQEEASAAAEPSPTREQRRPARVRVFIEDNGIGVASEHHKKIFGVFERIQGARKYEGTGIGLAIVARAVQRMQGTCGVESGPNGGSRFWIELPGI